MRSEEGVGHQVGIGGDSGPVDPLGVHVAADRARQSIVPDRIQ